MEITKEDWHLFREKITDWQEAYMERLIGEYREILSGDADASDKFWQLEERIRKDKKHPGVILEIRKQNLLYDLARLIGDGVITFDDIGDFSEEMKEAVNILCGRHD